MSKTLKMSVVLLVGGLLLVGSAHATTGDFQAAVAADTSLMHQWSFEGLAATAVVDSKGTNTLTETNAGAGPGVGYNIPGFDSSSTAASTYNDPLDNNFGGGSGDYFMTSANIAPPTTFSWEVIVQTGYAPIVSDPGDGYNLGYVISHRPGTPRGYFLWQGTSSSDIGDGFNSLTGEWAGSEVTVVPAPLAANNWYYMAGTYTVNTGDGTSQVDVYAADLTAGDTVLTHTGFPNPAAYDYDVAGVFGIGGRMATSAEAFPGMLDEVNLYGSALSMQTLQGNLDALLVPVPEPMTMSLLVVGGLGLISRRRRK